MRGALSREGLGSLLYLITFGIVVAATAGLFLGVGFTWLTDPPPTRTAALSVLPEQALKVDEFPLPGDATIAQPSSPRIPAEKAAESPITNTLPLSDGTTKAPPTREAPLSGSTAIVAMLSPPAAINHAKRVRVVRYPRQVTERRRTELWRPDARAGPHPGGGFYGPPNINVGYINPR
jgi:hypothetical protein